MPQSLPLTRRSFVAAAGTGAAALSSSSLAMEPLSAVEQPPGWGAPLQVMDPIRTELVMNLVVTCSLPERMGPNSLSKDGVRDQFWPIIGGRFEGTEIRGSVVPGGADFPVRRPDGVEVIDALYRLRTDDGVTIIIHNQGLTYPGEGEWPQFRLAPTFTVPIGKYDWLNKSIFLSTLLPVPSALALASGPNENDRLIQVHRVF